MKGMQKIKRGTGFRGLLNYLIEHDGDGHDDPGRIIGGNMSGLNARQLAAEFAAFRQLRADIQKPVWHNSLRLPPGDSLTDEEWQRVVDDYMSEMGFDSDHPYVIVAHDDEGAVHIAACRVSANGNVYLGKNENLKSTRIIKHLEEKHGLRMTKGLEYEEDADGNFHIVGGTSDTAKLSKNEIEKSIRTGEEPAKQKLQRIIADAKTGNPTVIQFVERLSAAGVTAYANIASTGKMNGFSFEIDGIPFKGSQLGKAYSWNRLCKEVSYEQTRDSEALRQYDRTARSNTDSQRLADSDRSDAADLANSRSLGQSDFNGTDSQRLSNNDRNDATERPDAENPRQSRIEDRASGSSTGRLDDGRTGGTDESLAVSGVISTTTRESDSAPVKSDKSSTVGCEKEPTVNSKGGSAVVNDVKHTDVHGSYSRVLDLSCMTVNNAAHRAKLNAWKQQHDALLAPAYRITLTSRRENLKTYNLGKRKNGDKEQFYSADDVAKMLPTLSRQNARGYDIYITPIDENHHYIVVDDMTEQTYSRLVKSGYSPALVQTSSDNNRQAVIKVERDLYMPRHIEQSTANKLVQYFNKEVGDPKFSGVIHPFRLAGFSNKKPGRNDFFTRILESSHRLCAKATQALRDFRDDALRSLKKPASPSVKTSDSRTKKYDYSQVDGSDIAAEAYARVLRQVQRAGWKLDASAVDFRVAQDLLERGYDTQQVESLIVSNSPSIYDRHRDVIGYVSRTVSKAYSQMHSVEQSENAAEKDVSENERRTMYARPK